MFCRYQGVEAKTWALTLNSNIGFLAGSVGFRPSSGRGLAMLATGKDDPLRKPDTHFANPSLMLAAPQDLRVRPEMN